MLPGSMRGSRDSDGGEGEQLGQLQSHSLTSHSQRHTARGQGSINMHVLHGVKSGAWGLQNEAAQAAFGASSDGQQ